MIRPRQSLPRCHSSWQALAGRARVSWQRQRRPGRDSAGRVTDATRFTVTLLMILVPWQTATLLGQLSHDSCHRRRTRPGCIGPKTPAYTPRRDPGQASPSGPGPEAFVLSPPACHGGDSDATMPVDSSWGSTRVQLRPDRKLKTDSELTWKPGPPRAHDSYYIFTWTWMSESSSSRF